MHPLEHQIVAIRRRVRGLLGLHALAWLAGSATAVVLVLCLADYWLHFEDRGVRLMLTAAWVGAIGWAAWRFVWPAMAVRFSTVELAQRVERRFPQFKDRLASTVQFLEQPEDDWRAGSGALRRTVIHQTTAEAERLNLADVIDVRPVARTLLAASLVLLAAVGVYALDPSASRLALMRLINPLGTTEWPKTNHLGFVREVTRVASGDSFQLEVIDIHGASLPPQVDLHLRYSDEGEINERVETARPVHDSLTFNIDEVRRPFSYRATGGDDATMPWVYVEVVDPPTVDRLQAQLHYPDYTGWATAASDGHLQALVGTRVALAGRASKPLRSISFQRDDGTRIAGVIGSDPHEFFFPLDGERPIVIDKSGWYVLDLEDIEQIHGGQGARYDVRAIEDRPPSVAIEQPDADKFVTADAVVPLRVAVKDDLAIGEVTLAWSQAGHNAAEPGESSSLTLDEGSRPASTPRSTPDAAGESRVLEHSWDLAPLGLKRGMTLEVIARASDLRPQQAESHVRRLTIVSPDELQDRLAERRAFVLGELARLAALQRESRAQVAGLEIQLDQVSHLSPADVDHLQKAELTQRQVERGLGGASESVPTHIASLLADLQHNHVESTELEQRMAGVLEELRRLGRDDLPIITRELTAALKQSQSREGDAHSKDETPATVDRASLAVAGQHQDEVIGTLERILGELSEWDSYRRFHRELSDLRRDQERLAQDTAKTGADTLTQDLQDLSPQQVADLKRLGQRQLDMARAMDKIEQRMHEIEEQLRASDTAAADTIDDALAHARRSTLTGRMREAARQVEGNQVGTAADAQQQIMTGLDEMLDILANRREHELDRLVARLRESERELQDLRARQDGLRKKMDAAAQMADPQQRKRELERLTREQRQLQEEAERFARKLQRLESRSASAATAKGSSAMGQAGESGAAGDAASAAEKAAAASRDLDEAQRQLAEHRRQAESDLAEQQLARLEDTLASLKTRQDGLLEETVHYADREQAQGRLSRAEAMSIADLARQQSGLADETDAQAKKMTASAVIELALSSVAGDMRAAGQRLTRRALSADTQALQQAASRRVTQLLEALQDESASNAEQKDDAGGGGSGGNSPGGSNLPLAELRLMKSMQEDLNARTRALAEMTDDGSQVSAEQRLEFQRLAAEQGKLADLVAEKAVPQPEPTPGESESLEKLLGPQDKPLQ